jgi:hypothetical protein
MTAVKQLKPLNIDEFIERYEGTKSEFHRGEVWDDTSPQEGDRQFQAVPDHSYLQFCIGKVLGHLFHRTEGPKGPGGWWFFDEVGVKYGEISLFFHDLAGWKRARLPHRPIRPTIASQKKRFSSNTKFPIIGS